ncbi:hypothetical protein [Pseudomonas sp. Irchel s3h14]|uniref:hypothetical protein n=1 Tax=Pseudomonas sp. Irchel s3h14 TaxID=2009179 RepID=UPI0015962168|nr:hypothetical protein [Pseudomonas sp. Irchel s3h14]
MLTGERLQAPEPIGGKYVDAINADLMVAASPEEAVKVPLWRVNDNLPGTSYFCPIVVKTAAVMSAADLDVPHLFVITDDSAERRLYDSVLNQVSKPLMQGIRDQVTFASTRTQYPDGVVSNIEFTGQDQARPVWRYPNLGPHVVFMSNVIRRTITEQMREESRYLRSHIRARQAIKEVVEMPDQQADRLLRSIEQNEGTLSNVLAKEMPVLARPDIWAAIIEAVAQSVRGEEPIDSSVSDRYHPKQPVGR